MSRQLTFDDSRLTLALRDLIRQHGPAAVALAFAAALTEEARTPLELPSIDERFRCWHCPACGRNWSRPRGSNGK